MLIPAIKYEFDEANPTMTYLGHMGFFGFIGVEFGKQPGEAKGSENYLPMRLIRKSDLLTLDSSTHNPIGKSVSKLSRELAFILTNKHEAKIIDPISYCFRETIRNVFEHSNASECLAFAQGWPKYDEVELAILDGGRGIRKSLSEKYDKLTSDKEALELAIKPGITRANLDTATNDRWANSGFGLYVLSEIGRELGAFTLISGDAAVHLENGEIGFPDYHFSGTAVRLSMRRPKGENLKLLIEEIINRGEREADAKGQLVRASKSTHAVM